MATQSTKAPERIGLQNWVHAQSSGRAERTPVPSERIPSERNDPRRYEANSASRKREETSRTPEAEQKKRPWPPKERAVSGDRPLVRTATVHSTRHGQLCRLVLPLLSFVHDCFTESFCSSSQSKRKSALEQRNGIL